jgi:hypothetical protein
MFSEPKRRLLGVPNEALGVGFETKIDVRL